MGTIVYLGHASFLIKSNNYDIVLDPYMENSVPGLRFPKGIIADKVFCSHDHFDHCASNLISIKNDPKDVSCGKAIVPHDRDGGTKRGMNTIRMFDVDGYRVVHLGDTGCVPEKEDIEKFANCDVLLAPINGFFTINPSELKEICKIINPRIVVPMHFFMEEKNSGYPDDDMFSKFKKEFPNIEYLDKELDLDKYKDYQGSLVFKDYLQ